MRNSARRSARPTPRSKLPLTLGGLVLAVLAVVFGRELVTPSDSAALPQATDASLITHAEIGFRSRVELDEHFQKHGREFGDIHKGEYLRRAQELRDRPLGGGVLEKQREDGVISRFDETSGAFVAFNENLVIRTFFKPDDGVRYFERQALKEHE
jgi:pyocin large subunit-like protein